MLLDIKDLTVIYRTLRGPLRAVDDVNLSIFNKEIVSVVGESGSGKSTLGYAILKILPPNGEIINGEIWFNGVDLTKLDEVNLREIRGKEISIIFQDPMTSLDPLMRIGDQIIETVLEHENVSKEEAWERAEKVLESLGIDPERLYDYPHQLSGGMRQRVVIALSIVLNPKLIIADEPTTGLDVIVQYQILELVRKLKGDYGISFIFITHDLGIAYDISDRIAVMYAGQIVELSDKKKIFENPMHPYTQGLFKSIPEISVEKKEMKSIPGYPPDLVNPPKGCYFNPRCPIAREKCKSKTPDLMEVEKGHYVRCYYAGEEAF